MAITKLLTAASIGVNTQDTKTDGITHITQASAEASAGTVVRAKDGQGDIVGVLLGKKVFSLSVSGYSARADGAKLGDDLTVGNVKGIVTSSTIEATAEDFTKFTAEGKAKQGEIV